MTVSLKAKHLFLIANLIQGMPLNRFLALGSTMRAQLSYDTDPEALLSVECTADNLVEIYTMLGQQTESLMTMPNQEMKEVLLPQVQSGVMAGDADWTRIYMYITSVEANNRNVRAQMENTGKEFIIGYTTTTTTTTQAPTTTTTTTDAGNPE